MNAIKKYSGVVVPMVTPVDNSYRIDRSATPILVDHLISNGAHPFILGTTGESASVSRSEKLALVKATINASAGKGTIYAGISGNSLYDSLEDARQYHDLGIGVFVATMPSYYPADPDQMERYFTQLADALPTPLIIYNIPATTHLSIPLSLVDRLSQHPNIVGFKDSERSMERLETSVSLWKERTDFSYLSGWAAMSHKAIELGADGIIPSTGNLTPHLYQVIYTSGGGHEGWLAQEKADRISELYQKDRTLSRALPVLKTMMAAYGLCQPEMLPPMYPLTRDEQRTVQSQTLSLFGDLNQINSMN
ncbi:4-hydroxy-tetrahydrodipicolinate synthase [Dyadobacter sp. CECT 9275]|uniref:4-hydroxy-tetrahydrodipicolinate synthase n=1 Tax=Dyadobacter helix TaxID=2822344 RepID=A0A916NEJ2_9BACT|nr:dihydrodipicolinate synthase family protein [Dyadobacter sp. CECT 9275]CAG5016976.1 4-hydroxy-tetrahydrodipicolinate synthase [Dyadobacter sp. CECT 9275]